MRKTILILFLSISTHNLFSQDSLLKKFKFRNVNYRAVTFGVNGSGGYNNTDYVSGRSKSHSASGNLGATYYMLKSSDRILLNASGGFTISHNSSKSENVSADNKSRFFYFIPQFNVLNKWFSKKFFTELGAEASTGLSSSKDIFSNPSRTLKSSQDNYVLSVTAGIGKGRLENIMDMQNALWLHDALKREGRLSRSLSAEELNGLGEAIIKANNTRVLDFRKRTQFVLETVDDYLQQKGLVDKTDITYFSNLNDILFFAINYPRLSGTERYIRFTPAITYRNNDQSQTFPSTSNENKSTVRSARLSIGLKRYIPINLRHQNNYGIGLYANYLENDANQKYFVSGVLVNEIITDPILRQAGADLFFEHAIYPNTRTVINFNLQSEGGYQKINTESSAYGNVTLNGSFNYFISYRTRFTAAIGVLYQSNMYRLNSYYLELMPDNLQLYANAGIQVSL